MSGSFQILDCLMSDDGSRVRMRLVKFNSVSVVSKMNSLSKNEVIRISMSKQ